MGRGIEILVFDDDQVTLENQCPNDGTVEWRHVRLVIDIRILDTATGDVVANSPFYAWDFNDIE